MLSEGVLADLRAAVGHDGLITDPARLLVYESDGLTAHRQAPAAVVLPRSTEQVQRVVEVLGTGDIPFVPRGAGTGLSGGCLAGPDAVVIGTARMNRILHIDPANRTARVEPGVVNAHLTEATRPHGLYYAPDPSSQSACTLGGNVAENSGGPHCLKYGVTSRYVTGLTVVLPTGDTVALGGWGRPAGLDLVGLFVGSEGNFGIATEIEVRLLPLPESVRTLLAIFDRVEDAGRAVTEIISRGLLPAALEIIDGPTIRAVEASIYAAGYPTDAGAALVVEFDGVEAGLPHESALARRCCEEAGARTVRVAESAEERAALWQGRKKAFGAMGRIAPDLLVQDATVPRTRLPDVLGQIGEIGERYGLKVANVFHAGDGNLHPNILFDRRDPDELDRVEAASREIMQACVDSGGTITGEHGVGLDKRAYMHLIHDPATLDAMAAVKRVFDPGGRCNPDKVLPDDVWARAAATSMRNGRPEAGAPDRRPEDEVRAAMPASVPLESWPDGGHPFGGPTVLVRPADTQAASAVMSRAHAERIRTAPVGGMTWTSAWGLGGPPPGPVDLAVSAEGMDQIVQYEPADLTITAGAGLTLLRLAEVARENGQWLALDPRPTGTVGGLVATASSGPLVAGFGGPRDHVLGATLVTGDGRVLGLGGRVVKNVAGYDLLKLAVGSWGTIGLITEVTVRLHPLPDADVTVAWLADTAEELVPTALALATASIVPASLELVAGGQLPGVDAPAALLARVIGSGDAVSASARILATRAGRAPDAERAGPESAQLCQAIVAGGPPAAEARVWRRPGELPELARLADLAAAAGRSTIHITEGLLNVAWPAVPAEEDLERLGRGGFDVAGARVLSGPGRLRALFRGDGSELPARDDLASRLRRTFDPRGILWPVAAL